MDALKVTGGNRLSGGVRVSGSKNASLPILAATLLAEGRSRIYGVPRLQDVRTMIKILTALGAEIDWSGDCLTVDTSGISNCTAPYELVKQMRASVCLLGPLLARFGRAAISLPGGCVIGDRPIDMHLKGLEKLSVRFTLSGGYVRGRAARLSGSSIFLGGTYGSSVLATANVMMAACRAEGDTVIEFAACEPEIVNLADFLNRMGARIEGAGSHLVKIQGVRRLRPTEFRILPDRIEAGTYLIAGALTRGQVTVENCVPEHLFALMEKLQEAGVTVRHGLTTVEVQCRKRVRSVDIATLPYPGFPTDLQAQFMSLMVLADGTSLINENVFPERFMHAAELKRLGADIILKDGTAIVRGRKRLTGTGVMASDLRASAALVLAGLAAEGETVVSRIYHLDRGYENMETKLGALGAEVVRFSE
ncbi:MAG TPA: UDP-N-acetylglucosamine 1-carboxyvinyltransferase [bacterium]|nr:UDP-N-acetylglucosamine 1-carboxyvinyltransferase [bacterium]HNS48002.1 UDP-N-acetylglucosamine 1-carboxyvinyltransferase [bacterium]